MSNPYDGNLCKPSIMEYFEKIIMAFCRELFFAKSSVIIGWHCPKYTSAFGDFKVKSVAKYKRFKDSVRDFRR